MDGFRGSDPTSPLLSSLEDGYTIWAKKNYTEYGSLDNSSQTKPISPHITQDRESPLEYKSNVHRQFGGSNHTTSDALVFLLSKFRSALRSTPLLAFPSISDHVCDARHDYLSIKQLQTALIASSPPQRGKKTSHSSLFVDSSDPPYISSSTEYNHYDLRLMMFHASAVFYLACVMGCFIFLLTTLLQFLYTTLQYFQQYGLRLLDPPLFVPLANTLKGSMSSQMFGDNGMISAENVTYLTQSLRYLSGLHKYITWVLTAFITCIIIGISITPPLTRIASRKFILKTTFIGAYIACSILLLFLFTNAAIVPSSVLSGNGADGGGGINNPTSPGIYSIFISLRQALTWMNKTIFQQFTRMAVSVPFLSTPTVAIPEGDTVTTTTGTAIASATTAATAQPPFFFLIPLLYLLITALFVIGIGSGLGISVWTLASYVGELGKPIRRSQLGSIGLLAFLVGLLVASTCIHQTFYAIIDSHTHSKYHSTISQTAPTAATVATAIGTATAESLNDLTTTAALAGAGSLTQQQPPTMAVTSLIILFTLLTIACIYSLYIISVLPESPMWMLLPHQEGSSKLAQRLSNDEADYIMQLFHAFVKENHLRPTDNHGELLSSSSPLLLPSSTTVRNERDRHTDTPTMRGKIHQYKSSIYSGFKHIRDRVKADRNEGGQDSHSRRNDRDRSGLSIKRSQHANDEDATVEDSDNSGDDDIIIDLDPKSLERKAILRSPLQLQEQHHTDQQSGDILNIDHLFKPECCIEDDQVLLPDSIPRHHEHEHEHQDDNQDEHHQQYHQQRTSGTHDEVQGLESSQHQHQHDHHGYGGDDDYDCCKISPPSVSSSHITVSLDDDENNDDIDSISDNTNDEEKEDDNDDIVFPSNKVTEFHDNFNHPFQQAGPTNSSSHRSPQHRYDGGVNTGQYNQSLMPIESHREHGMLHGNDDNDENNNDEHAPLIANTQSPQDLRSFLHQSLPQTTIARDLSYHEQLLLSNLIILRQRFDIGFESAVLVLYSLQTLRSYDVFSHGYSTHGLHWMERMLSLSHSTMGIPSQSYGDIESATQDDHQRDPCLHHAHPQTRVVLPVSLLQHTRQPGAVGSIGQGNSNPVLIDPDTFGQPHHSHPPSNQLQSLSSRQRGHPTIQMATTSASNDLIMNARDPHPATPLRGIHAQWEQWDQRSIASAATSQLFTDHVPYQLKSMVDNKDHHHQHVPTTHDNHGRSLLDSRTNPLHNQNETATVVGAPVNDERTVSVEEAHRRSHHEQTPLQMLLSIPFAYPAPFQSPHPSVSSRTSSNSNPIRGGLHEHDQEDGVYRTHMTREQSDQSSPSYLHVISNSLPFLFPLSMFISYRKQVLPMFITGMLMMIAFLLIVTPSFFIPHHLMTISSMTASPLTSSSSSSLSASSLISSSLPSSLSLTSGLAHTGPHSHLQTISQSNIAGVSTQLSTPDILVSMQTHTLAPIVADSFINGEIPSSAYDPPSEIKDSKEAGTKSKKSTKTKTNHKQSILPSNLILTPNPQAPGGQNRRTPRPSTVDSTRMQHRDDLIEQDHLMDDQQRQEEQQQAIALQTLHQHLFSNAMLLSFTLFSSYNQLLLVCALVGAIVGCVMTILSYYCNSAIYLVKGLSSSEMHDDGAMFIPTSSLYQETALPSQEHSADASDTTTPLQPQRIEDLCQRSHHHTTSTGHTTAENCVIGYGSTIRWSVALGVSILLLICASLTIISLFYHNADEHPVLSMLPNAGSFILPAKQRHMSQGPSSSSLPAMQNNAPTSIFSILCPYFVPMMVFLIFVTFTSCVIVTISRDTKLPPFLLSTLLPITLTLGGLLTIIVVSITILFNNRIRLLWFCFIVLAACSVVISHFRNH